MRVSLPDHTRKVPIPEELVLLMEGLQTTPVISKLGPIMILHLSTKVKLVLQGWIDTKDPNIQPYQCRKEEMSVQDGYLLWRVLAGA